MKDSRALAVLLPLLVVACLAAAYYAIEAQKRSKRIAELEGQVASLLPKASSAQASFARSKSFEVKRVARSVEQTVFCPLCEGEGQVAIEDVRQQVVGSYPCPVCKARGAFPLKVPRGNDVCKACSGMGRIGVAPKEGKEGKYHARLCVKCNGQGWRKSKS